MKGIHVYLLVPFLFAMPPLTSFNIRPRLHDTQLYPSNKRCPAVQMKSQSDDSKRTNRANVKDKLHQPTETPPLGIGESITSVPNRALAQGKRQVWMNRTQDIGSKKLKSALEFCRSANQRFFRSSESAAVEIERFTLYCRLREYLPKLVCLNGIKSPPPLLAFERWQFECKLAEELNAANLNLSDPLFPAMPNFLEPQLVEDLQRIRLSRQQGIEIAKEMARESCRCASVLAQFHQKFRQSGVDDSIVPILNRHNVDLKLGIADRNKFKVNYEHISKLKDLWVHTRQSIISPSRENSGPAQSSARSERCGAQSPQPSIDGTDPVSAEFRRDVFRLLVRYQALEGHGFQAAVGEHAFAWLVSRLGVEVECFASPLNCHLPHYCSAFADTDAAFGSLGSFFRFRPAEGSFEANPPFVPFLLDRAVAHMDELLAAATGPMSFAVVVPGWQEDPGWRRLQGSRFRRRLVLLSRADHGFVDGAQHQRQDRYRPSPFDTAVFLLQNDAGAAAWPLSAEDEAALRVAFAQSMPSPAAMLRRRRAGLYMPRPPPPPAAKGAKRREGRP